jgi:hypothetical protein
MVLIVGAEEWATIQWEESILGGLVGGRKGEKNFACIGEEG